MIINGNCVEVMRGMDDASVDAIVTDPPYGINFMNKGWDNAVPGVEVWRECLRVLKPGGHILAFAGTRTQHRMASAIDDAGFEIRDMIAWVYGSGFPKSHDVSKAIDKAAGAVREAQQWQGWGTALKPALEPITVGRKPMEGTVAANVLQHGTGAINIDGCRVGSDGGCKGATRGPKGEIYGDGLNGKFAEKVPGLGRFPANLIHDGDAGLGEQSRFFYQAKASKADRNDGMSDHAPKPTAAAEFRPNHTEKAEAGEDGNPYGRWTPTANNHPTVKPTDLMRYLCRLVTPPGGVVLDPFAGSGSTGRGALLEGFRFIGVELDPHYADIARARIKAVEADAILARMKQAC